MQVTEKHAKKFQEVGLTCAQIFSVDMWGGGIACWIYLDVVNFMTIIKIRMLFSQAGCRTELEVSLHANGIYDNLQLLSSLLSLLSEL